MSDYPVPVRPASRPAAFWGMAILVASEATLFAAFIGTYFYLRFKSPHWPPDGLPEPKVLVPLILVAALLASSIPMALASAAAQAGRLAATRRFLLLALVAAKRLLRLRGARLLRPAAHLRHLP